MEPRLKLFAKILKDKKLDGFIVTNPVNIFYLTGFKGLSPTEREAILVFDPNATLVTARLYQNEAEEIAKIHLRGEKSSHLKGGNVKLQVKITNERNHLIETVQKLLKNSRRIGFESRDITFNEFKEFKKNLTGAKLIPFKSLVEDLRAIKADEEIKKIETAQIVSQKAFGQIIKTIKIGQTEEEIAEKLAQIIKSLGGQGLAFESIIASGPNSGKPHHFTSNRPLTANDTLLLDFGSKYQDYCADLSRTIFIDRARDQQRNIFHHVLKAQKTAIEKIAHGSKSHEIHKIANDLFKKQKLEKYFLHGLGHGIGLEVHENPHLRLAPRSLGEVGPKLDNSKSQEEILSENMVFSIEPGLYFPNFGIRIEDLVVIKNGKARVLGKSVEEIIEI